MFATQTSLRVEILGTLRMHRGPRLIDLGPTKQRAVFAYLALHAGEIVSVDALLAAVWGEDPPQSARHLLHTYIARLRQACEPEMPPRGRVRVIASAPPGYQLLLAGGQIDKARVEHLVAQAQKHLDLGAWSRALDLLGEAVRMWRDPTLSELRGLLPTSYEVDALRQSWLDAALEYVTIGLDHNLAPAVLPVADRLAAAEPLHEEIQARYLAVLEQTGQRQVAIQRFSDIRARLVAELGIEPGPALAAAYRHLLAGSQQPAGRLAMPANGAGRPPWRGARPGVCELVELEADVTSLVEILSAQRLVTVAGPPGCGKSALAFKAATRMRDSFPGGVAVVDVADAADRTQLLGSIRRIFDCATGDDLVEVLGDREVLLVLDNVEHVVDACAAAVDQIVRGCGGVSAIVTSREPLGLPYETVWRVRPLPLPEPGPSPSPGNAAVRLFARLAAQVRPGFRLSVDNLEQVSAICRGLDGLPLAIEFAAASLATESLDDVLRNLADPLRRTEPPRRGRPAHHRSLYDALCRSLDCLTAVERWVFVRLGGLPPAFSQVEVVQACAPGPWHDLGVSAVLYRLVDKSLLSVSHDSDTATYRMLGIVHRFAAELHRGAPAGINEAPAPVRLRRGRHARRTGP